MRGSCAGVGGLERGTGLSDEAVEAIAASARFAGIARLYGGDALRHFARSHVAVVGLGGVGSWVVEALARSGLGRITMIDLDDICESNTNRQLHAVTGAYGKPKAIALAERIAAVNPWCRTQPVLEFVTNRSIERLLGVPVDFVVDAADSLRAKGDLIAYCRRRRQPLVTVGSAGGRTDPTQIRVRDLSRTERDAMLALVRKRLRSEYGFPRNPKRYFGVKAVYSLEQPHFPTASGGVCRARADVGTAGGLDCSGGLGACTAVTGAFGFAAAAHVLQVLARAAAERRPRIAAGDSVGEQHTVAD